MNYDVLPTLAEIELAKLLWPHQKRLIALQGRCRKVLSKYPNHWTVKATYKLDRQVFPTETQNKGRTEQERIAAYSPPDFYFSKPDCPDPKRVARLLAALKVTHANYEDLRDKSLVGSVVTKIVMDAVWRQDDKFLTDFGEALRKRSGIKDVKTARICNYLLRNADAVERCKSGAEIFRLPGFPCKDFDPSTRQRLLREIGLAKS